jgi:hypothetical protein
MNQCTSLNFHLHVLWLHSRYSDNSTVGLFRLDLRYGWGFPSSSRPDWPCNPLNLLLDSLPGLKWPGCKADDPPSPKSQLRIRGATTPFIWFFLTPSIATKFQYILTLFIIYFFTHYMFRPLRAMRYTISYLFLFLKDFLIQRIRCNQ